MRERCPRPWFLLGALLAGMLGLAGCAPEPRPAPKPAAPTTLPAPRAEALEGSPPPPPAPPRPVTAAEGIEHCATIRKTCEVETDPDVPEDLRDVERQRRIAECGAILPELSRLARSPLAVVRGEALYVGGYVFNYHRCGQPEDAGCLDERCRPSTLCPDLAWVPDQLIRGFAADDTAVRSGAFRGLVYTSVEPRLALPTLRRVLREARPDPEAEAETDERIQQALVVLAMLREGAAPAIPELDAILEARLEHRDGPLHATLDAVAALGEAGAPLRPRVIAALSDRRPNVRWLAARALGAIGTKEDVPHLQKLRGDPESFVRHEAERAAERLTFDRAIDFTF
ncbi:MAG: HEAT repeat domain-containing protein [Polyangiaceae bacterium]